MIAPVIYPAEEFTSNGLEVVNNIVAFIAYRFKTMQNCNGTYKGFISINNGNIKILQIQDKIGVTFKRFSGSLFLSRQWHHLRVIALFQPPDRECFLSILRKKLFPVSCLRPC